jgi:hypothetical protein
MATATWPQRWQSQEPKRKTHVVDALFMFFVVDSPASNINTAEARTKTHVLHLRAAATNLTPAYTRHFMGCTPTTSGAPKKTPTKKKSLQRHSATYTG